MWSPDRCCICTLEGSWFCLDWLKAITQKITLFSWNNFLVETNFQGCSQFIFEIRRRWTAHVLFQANDPAEPRRSAVGELTIMSTIDDKSYDRWHRFNPRQWRLRIGVKYSPSSSSSSTSVESDGMILLALSSSIPSSSPSNVGHRTTGKAMESSTCCDAWTRSVRSKEPHCDLDRFLLGVLGGEQPITGSDDFLMPMCCRPCGIRMSDIIEPEMPLLAGTAIENRDCRGTHIGGGGGGCTVGGVVAVFNWEESLQFAVRCALVLVVVVVALMVTY